MGCLAWIINQNSRNASKNICMHYTSFISDAEAACPKFLNISSTKLITNMSIKIVTTKINIKPS
jgi:hypothetical protein